MPRFKLIVHGIVREHYIVEAESLGEAEEKFDRADDFSNPVYSEINDAEIVYSYEIKGEDE